MFFEEGIPDKHVGFYSKNVLGDDARNGEVSVAYINGQQSDFVYDSWFYGYYLNGPSNSSPQTQGHLNNVSESFINFTTTNTGSSPRGGWVFALSAQQYIYFSIHPFAFDDTKKYLWAYIPGVQRWFLFNRYYCIKDSRLGLDNTNFNTFTTSYQYYWIREVLGYSSDGMTAGEGILSYADVYSGGQAGFVLLKPYGNNNLRVYFGNNSQQYSFNLW